MNKVTKVFEFDSAHRVMHEKVKCFNLHGHRFRLELTLGYGKCDPIGYAIDFKEIKRVFGTWIDEHFDHSCILNPKDEELISLCKENHWKLYIMGMGAKDDCNPSAENLASEILYVAKVLLDGRGVEVVSVRLYETPNCWVDVSKFAYVAEKKFMMSLKDFRDKLGIFKYDDRE